MDIPTTCEYLKRASYLEELYNQIKMVSGFSPESLLSLFSAGYTLKPPVPPKTMKDIEKELNKTLTFRK